MKIRLFSVAAIGPGISGGDKIFIELARQWSALGHTVEIVTSGDGHRMCQRSDLEDVRYAILDRNPPPAAPFLFRYAAKVIQAVAIGLRQETRDCPDLLYSASDFLPDVLPGLIGKLRDRRKVWMVSFYLLISSPRAFQGLKGGSFRASTRLRYLAYWIVQRLTVVLASRLADFVLVLNEDDKDFFVSRLNVPENRVIVVHGGIEHLNGRRVGTVPRFAACFVGRLHPQKGIWDLLAIWKEVTQCHPSAKLAIVGNGSEQYLGAIRTEVHRLELNDSVTFFGYLPDEDKARVLCASRVFVFPTHFESMGLVIAEALGCGLPVVTFGIDPLRSLYPSGVAFVPPFDTEAFAHRVLELLDDDALWRERRQEALAFSRTCTWRDSSNRIIQPVMRLLGTSASDVGFPAE